MHTTRRDSGEQPPARHGTLRIVTAVTALLGVVLAGLLSLTGSATATTYRTGPDPTANGLEAETGPLATDSVSVPSSVSGFGGGTIYFPTRQGTYGGVAISPGFTEKQSAIAWYGPRLASHGFVVITIDTNSVYDQPYHRSEQLLAALAYLTGQSAVKERVDADRLAVMGHSMGGGGALQAALRTPSLKAAVALTGWSQDKDFSQLLVPSLVIGAENDWIAPNSSHSRPFYDSMPASLEKAYLVLAGKGHLAPTKPNATIATHTVAWLKRFVDEDSRYNQVLCPGPVDDAAVKKYQATCPFGETAPTEPAPTDPTPTDPEPAVDWFSWFFGWFNWSGWGN